MSVILKKNRFLNFTSGLAQGKWTNEQIAAMRFGEGAKALDTQRRPPRMTLEDFQRAHGYKPVEMRRIKE